MSGFIRLVGQTPGTGTNDAAAAGNVGETIDSSVLGTSLTTATQTNITSISLTPGDWEISGLLNYAPAASTSIQYLVASVSVTSATSDFTIGRVSAVSFPSAYVPGSTTQQCRTISPFRLSLSATTTYYLVAQCGFGVSTMTVDGYIHARRLR